MKKHNTAPCVIECRGLYWTGEKFTKDKRAARRFPDDSAAWRFVDATFNDDVGEDCALHFIRAAKG